MLRKFEVEVLISFDKDYDDHEIHSYIVEIKDEINPDKFDLLHQRKLEEKAMIEAFDRCSKEHGGHKRHALEVYRLRGLRDESN